MEKRTELRDSVPPQEPRAPENGGNVSCGRAAPRGAISNYGLVVPQCDKVIVRPLQYLPTYRRQQHSTHRRITGLIAPTFLCEATARRKGTQFVDVASILAGGR